MMKKAKLLVISTLVLGFWLGSTAGQESRSSPFTGLTEQAANPSKMDWLILNTRVLVLEQTLKDQLSVPLSPTQYRFSSEKQEIQISVYVDLAWLAKRSSASTDEALSKRALELCFAPTMTAPPEYLVALMGAQKPPKDYCSISFWTHALTESGQLTVKDLAVYEKGILRRQ